jgi:hypothetical protein
MPEKKLTKKDLMDYLRVYKLNECPKNYSRLNKRDLLEYAKAYGYEKDQNRKKKFMLLRKKMLNYIDMRKLISSNEAKKMKFSELKNLVKDKVSLGEFKNLSDREASILLDAKIFK